MAGRLVSVAIPLLRNLIWPALIYVNIVVDELRNKVGFQCSQDVTEELSCGITTGRVVLRLSNGLNNPLQTSGSDIASSTLSWCFRLQFFFFFSLFNWSVRICSLSMDSDYFPQFLWYFYITPVPSLSFFLHMLGP